MKLCQAVAGKPLGRKRDWAMKTRWVYKEPGNLEWFYVTFMTRNSLVGGLDTFFIFHFIYGLSSFPLTNSIIFQRGRYTTNQLSMSDFIAWNAAFTSGMAVMIHRHKGHWEDQRETPVESTTSYLLPVCQSRNLPSKLGQIREFAKLRPKFICLTLFNANLFNIHRYLDIPHSATASR